MNEDFQTSQVRKYADVIYSWLESKLSEAIIDKLWLQETYTDEEWKEMPVEFEYAFKVLKDQWYTLNHIIKEEWWTATLVIRFFKIDTEVTYDIKTTYSISVTKS